MQWQDPYFSVSGPPGAGTNLDICFYYPPGAATPFACSDDVNIGSDPLEVMAITGSGNLEISIERLVGVDPDPVKLVMFGSIAFADTYAGTNAGTLYGHNNAAGANAVGASAYFLTPAFGENPPVLNFYSSAGNTPILFDTDGDPIDETREKPEFTGPDGGNNTFFGSDFEPDGWPNFFGTSASAPHAAAVAALMRELDPALVPAEITGVLQDTAIDILERETLYFGGPRITIGYDYDNDSGAGLIDAWAALDAIILDGCNLTAAPSPLDFGSVLVGETATEEVVLQNTGGAICNVTALQVTGDHFMLNPTATLPPFSVDAGGNVAVPVDYIPTDVGDDNGTLDVVSDDPDNPSIEVTLLGEGYEIPLEADLSISKTDSPDPVKIGSYLEYTITVTNLGPGTATGVTMTDKLPARTDFVLVNPYEWSCSGTSTVVCDLESLEAGSSAEVLIVVNPIRQGRLLNTATVEAAEDDPNTSNNSATEITRVRISRP